MGLVWGGGGNEGRRNLRKKNAYRKDIVEIERGQSTLVPRATPETPRPYMGKKGEKPNHGEG